MAEAPFASAHDGLGPVGDPQFGEDAGYVVGDRFGSYAESTGNRNIRYARRHEVEYLAFARLFAWGMTAVGMTCIAVAILRIPNDESDVPLADRRTGQPQDVTL